MNILCISSIAHRFYAVLVVVFVVAVATVHAQDRAKSRPESRPEPEIARLGIGVGIIPYTFPYNNTYDVQPAGVLSWYLPVQIGKYFRTEVEFAFASSQDRFPLQLGASQSAENIRNNLFFRFGIGTYYTHPVEENSRAYIGVRSGIVSSSVEWFSTPSGMNITYIYNESLGSFWIGGVVGFEYFLTKHITLGAELHGTSYTTGLPHTTSPLPSNYPRRFNPQFTSDAFITSALVALRFFF